MKIQAPSIILGIATSVLIACHPLATTVATAPAAPKPTTAQVLSQQNVDGVIYQNSSAEVYRLFQQGYELARIRLDANLARPHSLPPAVIVDIDETVLDNSPSNAQDAADGRTYSPAQWKKWTALGSAKALPGAVDFLNYAVSNGCEVFYISNRELDEEAATIRNLAEAGFPMADEAHVMPMEGTSDKTARRAAVAKDHYIALLVGDQLTDFDQRFHDRSKDYGKPQVDAMRDTLEQYFIMLPNSMYGTWLNAVSGRPDSLKPANKERFLIEHGY